jgi:hypothetical protein
MDQKKQPEALRRYEPESWRNDEDNVAPAAGTPSKSSTPDARDATRVFDLLGRVNYKIIAGNRVYVEVGGVVYKTLYGGYWRSVFTGIEHYLLRCEQVSGSIWAEEDSYASAVDLPVRYSKDGWTADGYSISFLLARDSNAGQRVPLSTRDKLKRRWLGYRHYLRKQHWGLI